MTDDSRFFFGFCHICQIKFDADELSSERKMDFYFFWSGFESLSGSFEEKMEWI
jgi:hypothetical protein